MLVSCPCLPRAPWPWNGWCCNIWQSTRRTTRIRILLRSTTQSVLKSITFRHPSDYLLLRNQSFCREEGSKVLISTKSVASRNRWLVIVSHNFIKPNSYFFIEHFHCTTADCHNISQLLLDNNNNQTQDDKKTGQRIIRVFLSFHLIPSKLSSLVKSKKKCISLPVQKPVTHNL